MTFMVNIVLLIFCSKGSAKSSIVMSSVLEPPYQQNSPYSRENDIYSHLIYPTPELDRSEEIIYPYFRGLEYGKDSESKAYKIKTVFENYDASKYPLKLEDQKQIELPLRHNYPQQKISFKQPKENNFEPYDYKYYHYTYHNHHDYPNSFTKSLSFPYSNVLKYSHFIMDPPTFPIHHAVDNYQNEYLPCITEVLYNSFHNPYHESYVPERPFSTNNYMHNYHSFPYASPICSISNAPIFSDRDSSDPFLPYSYVKNNRPANSKKTSGSLTYKPKLKFSKHAKPTYKSHKNILKEYYIPSSKKYQPTRDLVPLQKPKHFPYFEPKKKFNFISSNLKNHKTKTNHSSKSNLFKFKPNFSFTSPSKLINEQSNKGYT